MKKTILLPWITSIIATLGSLYFSEVMHFIPCTLCWFQRILMYPLSILLGVGVYYQDRKVYRYVLPLSIIGMFVSLYQYSLQKLPFMKQFETCTSGVPCSGQYINWLGFITIPLLAFFAFTIITISLILLKRSKDE